MQAYYVAESGAKAIAQHLIDYPESIDTLVPDETLSTLSDWTQLTSNHRFQVTVKRNYIPNSTVISSSVSITSLGEVSSGAAVSRSTVSLKLNGNSDTGFSWENAVWLKGNIE